MGFSLLKGNSVQKISDTIYSLSISGELMVAGVTKKIDIKVTLSKKNQLIMVDGNHQLKMTDFGINPPKALLGAIKTGDEIEVKFKSVFVK